MPVRPGVTRFRYHAALTVVAIVAIIGAVPLATVSWAWTPILLVPLAVAVFAWRAGTDADSEGVVVRALLGRRTIPWSQIVALVPDGPRRVRAGLTGGALVTLPAVTAADLPRLVAASGGELGATPDEEPGPDHEPS